MALPQALRLSIYPPRMDGNPPPDGRGIAEQPSPGAREEREAGPAERFGPLAVRRMAKDDGRALIVYEDRRPREGSGGAGARGARA